MSDDLATVAICREHVPQSHRFLMPTVACFTHLTMVLKCLRIKFLAIIHIGNHRDSGAWEVSKIKESPSIEPAFKEFTVLLQAGK